MAVSIVAAFAIGQSVAPALLEGGAFIRLWKEKGLAGTSPSTTLINYGLEKVPWLRTQVTHTIPLLVT